MVTAKDAVKISSDFVVDLFPESSDLRLEQVAPKGNEWEVVLSFKFAEPNSLLGRIGQPNREFKAVEVNRESGEPLALKVWKV